VGAERPPVGSCGGESCSTAGNGLGPGAGAAPPLARSRELAHSQGLGF
jgi:hypothetical protein